MILLILIILSRLTEIRIAVNYPMTHRQNFTDIFVISGQKGAFAFEGLQALQKAGFEQPPASEYALICEDTLLCCTDDSEEICLKLIFNRYNDNLPKGYCGRSIAPSDIVELYDEREKKYFYRDENLFYPVKFSPTQIKT